MQFRTEEETDFCQRYTHLLGPAADQYAAKFPGADPAAILRAAKLGLIIASRTYREGSEAQWARFCIRQQITAYLSKVAPRQSAPLPVPVRLLDAFVDRYLHLVPVVVQSIRNRLPSSFEWDDLIQAGRLGLVVAARTVPKTVEAERFDPEQWARWCIRRQILNEICGPSTGRPREDGKRNQERGPWIESKVCISLTAALDPHPGIDHAVNAAERLTSTPALIVQSPQQEVPLYSRASGVALRQVCRPNSQPDYERNRQAVKAAKECLTERQRKLLELVYEQNVGLREIGRKKLLGIGWRRVLREHQEALEIIRRHMTAAA